MKDCNNDLEILFNYISKGIIKKPYFISSIKPLTLNQISKFLKEKYNQNISEKAILKLDVDSDGLISYEDMKSILKRYNVTNFFKYYNKISNPQINFFSKENLSDDKIKSIIKTLYNYIETKNLNEIGLFKKLDKNGDGFISNVEFSLCETSILMQFSPLCSSIDLKESNG
jgi:Ca2+-binding EF-hand superfamily protein